jgi:hypothetical protein
MKNYFLLSMIILSLTSCTISFQNISTHGTANDLVDQNQDATADVKPVITVPLSPTGV